MKSKRNSFWLLFFLVEYTVWIDQPYRIDNQFILLYYMYNKYNLMGGIRVNVFYLLLTKFMPAQAFTNLIMRKIMGRNGVNYDVCYD